MLLADERDLRQVPSQQEFLPGHSTWRILESYQASAGGHGTPSSNSVLFHCFNRSGAKVSHVSRRSTSRDCFMAVNQKLVPRRRV